MIWNKSYEWVKQNAKHLEAVGETNLIINPETAPWEKAERVEVGGAYRYSGPTGVYIVFEDGPLTIKWSVDFEGRESNGAYASLFDRDRLREVMRKLPAKARASFAQMLETEVLPELQKRTAEMRDNLNKQADSEDCIRGLIALGQLADHPS